MNKKAILKSLQSEKLAVSMRHRNVVTIYHVNDRSDPAFVIMEYVGEVYSLYDTLKAFILIPD